MSGGQFSVTPHQSAYFAHALTLASPAGTVEGLSRSIASARVDLNPHQVDAALFALRSPLSRGVLLADEVGLGKTIEAGIVISQRWAERRRRVLLVVPATLRKQWEQELAEKFLLPAFVLDSRSFRAAVEAGVANPFEAGGAERASAAGPGTPDRIVICSYQFAAARQAEVALVPWDLVVIDEAHRLRNVYKTSSKIARALVDAIGSRNKLLLTATPLQNSLMELYGLVSVIDPQVFGDARARAPQGVHRAADALVLLAQPILQRVLAVVAAGEGDQREVPRHVEPRIEEAVVGLERRACQASFRAHPLLHRRADAGQRAAEARHGVSVGAEVAQETEVVAHGRERAPRLEQHEADVEAEVEALQHRAGAMMDLRLDAPVQRLQRLGIARLHSEADVRQPGLHERREHVLAHLVGAARELEAHTPQPEFGVARKDHDRTRLVNNASGWTDMQVGDVSDVHDCPGPRLLATEDGRALVLGEFGGLGLPIAGHTWVPQNSQGCRSFESKDALGDTCRDVVAKLPDDASALNAAVIRLSMDEGR